MIDKKSKITGGPINVIAKEKKNDSQVEIREDYNSGT
jgi:hypothetical protein